jgi:hypothetical protein
MGEVRDVYRVLVGSPEGKRPMGRSRRRWGIIIKWIFRIWVVGVMDRIELAQNRDRWRAIVNALVNLRIP